MKSLQTIIGRLSPRLLWLIKGWHKDKTWCDIAHPRTLFALIGQEAIRHGDDPTWALSADKWAVRQLVADTIGEQYLVPAYGYWTSPDDIDFNTLPSAFAMKVTNGCGTNLIVTDKSQLNVEEARRQLRGWDIKEYAAYTGQPHYGRVPYGIIAEQLLVEPGHSSPSDWKFYCVNGKPVLMGLVTDRAPGAHQCPVVTYDMDFNPRPDYTPSHLYVPQQFEKPQCWEQLKEAAAALAAPHRLARIDFYVIDGKPYFGEITLTPDIYVHLSPSAIRHIYSLLTTNPS